jgi:hypothetical protein
LFLWPSAPHKSPGDFPTNINCGCPVSNGIGLAGFATTLKEIPRDTPITHAMVNLRENLAEKLLREQD